MSRKIKCLIIDDEPIGRKIIENYVSQISFLDLVASCEDAFEAMDILQQQLIVLLFSDIQMPKINGLELVGSLPSSPMVIFITAHENFAIKGFDTGAIDYLLKPVSFDRFLKAVNKARQQIELRESNAPSSSEKIRDFIFLKVDNKLIKIQYKNILYIESVQDYIKVFFGEGKILCYSTMKAIEEKLPSDQFFRIHNSYIIRFDAIKLLMGNTVELINGTSLPVSKSHKDKLFAVLQINNK